MKILNMKNRAGYLAIAVGLVLLILVGPFLAQKSTDSILLREAEISANQWGNYLNRVTPELELIARGQSAGSHSYHMLNLRASNGSGVFHVRIFDLNGKQTFQSKNPSYGPFSDVATTKNHDAHAMHGSHIEAKTSQTSKTHYGSELIARFNSQNSNTLNSMKHGNGNTMPLHYSEATMPIKKRGETVGFLNLLIDQTETSSFLKRSLSIFKYSLIALATIAFLLPVSVLVHHLRQQNINAVTKLDFATQHDDLTLLMNRNSFQHLVSDFITDKHRLSILFVDLDKFKDVNDRFGHDVGDKLLQNVSKRLKHTIGDNAVICRYGGDEFVICKCDDDPQAIVEIGNSIVSALSHPFIIDGLDIKIGSSVGAAILGKHGDNVDQLIKASDIAMYDAKCKGRGRMMMFSGELEKARMERLNMELLLRHAAEDDKFSLHYQPLLQSTPLKLHGFEALLRLNDNDGNMISPAVFVPIAEDTGLMEKIGETVLIEACKQAALWHQGLIVSVNLSVTQFSSGKLLSIVQNALHESSLAPERLQLEVTESLLAEDAEFVLQQLNELRELGVFLSLDDFGTGFSSLNSLWQYPFHNLKIDRSFVKKIETNDKKTQAILETIIDMGRTLGLTTTAEGIETEYQMASLQKLNCNYLQGFYLGKPMEVQELPGFMLTSKNNEFSRSHETASHLKIAG